MEPKIGIKQENLSSVAHLLAVMLADEFLLVNRSFWYYLLFFPPIGCDVGR